MSYPKSLAEAFWMHCATSEDGCWSWTGNRRSSGYGRVTFRRIGHYAHRVSYELAKGAIPDGMTVDHMCHNRDSGCPGGSACLHRLCVRPDHLELAPATVNASRAGRVARTGRCSKGHAVAGTNVYIIRGMPACRRCQLDRQLKYEASKSAGKAHKAETSSKEGTEP